MDITMSELKFPKGYRKSPSLLKTVNVDFSSDGGETISKTVPMVATEQLQENGEYVLIGYCPVNQKEQKVYASGTIVTLNDKMTADYRKRSVRIAGGEWQTFEEVLPTARKGDQRQNVIRQVKASFTVNETNGRQRPMAGKVTLGGSDDRTTDTLTIVARLEGAGGGRSAKAAAEGDDDF